MINEPYVWFPVVNMVFHFLYSEAATLLYYFATVQMCIFFSHHTRWSYRTDRHLIFGLRRK